MTECTTADCGAPSELYLCPPCIRDLQAWIDKGRELLPELDVTIARLDNVRVGNVEGGNGSKSAGSAAPLDLTALQIQMDLQADLAWDAAQYASDPWSVGEVPRIIENIRKAELMVSGPEEPRIDHEANKAKVKEIAPPMRMRELLPWLRANARIAITSQAVRNWVHRGHLTPASRGTPAALGKPATESTYHPHEVITAWHERNNQ